LASISDTAGNYAVHIYAYGSGAETFATLVRWLGMSQEQFLRPTRKKAENADPVAMISSYLRGAKNISHAEAEAMEDILAAAFRHLTKGRK
jgi:hypothetical protein